MSIGFETTKESVAVVITSENFHEYIGSRVIAHQLGSDGSLLEISSPESNGKIFARGAEGEIVPHDTVDTHFFVNPGTDERGYARTSRLFKLSETVICKI